jgi:hypothetical protein
VRVVLSVPTGGAAGVTITGWASAVPVIRLNAVALMPRKRLILYLLQAIH